jgi:hypothetical protein
MVAVAGVCRQSQCSEHWNQPEKLTCFHLRSSVSPAGLPALSVTLGRSS